MREWTLLCNSGLWCCHQILGKSYSDLAFMSCLWSPRCHCLILDPEMVLYEVVKVGWIPGRPFSDLGCKVVAGSEDLNRLNLPTQ